MCYFCKRDSCPVSGGILLTLNMREVLAQDKCLGLSTYIGQSKKKPFLYIKDKLSKCLSGWMDKLVSWAGREVVIKAVAQAILTYAMSVFKFPKDFCNSIQSIINRFWWSNDPKRRKIHWVSCARLCEKRMTADWGFGTLKLLTMQCWPSNFGSYCTMMNYLSLNCLKHVTSHIATYWRPT